MFDTKRVLTKVLVSNILVRNRCVKEEDILTLCKFEKKQFRAILTALKNEKILLYKVRVEPTPNAPPDPETGKQPTTKYTYYHIDYRKRAQNLYLVFIRNSKFSPLQVNSEHSQVQASQNAGEN